MIAKNRNKQAPILCHFILVLAMVFTSTNAAQAQKYAVSYAECPQVFKERSGRVMAAAPAKVRFEFTKGPLTVRVKKTSGRARTQVIFFEDNQQKSRTIDFPSGKGNTNSWRTITFNYPANSNAVKNMRVEIINQSVGHTFGYELELIGNNKSLQKTNGNYSGNIRPQQGSDFVLNRSCTGSAEIVIKKSGFVDIAYWIYEKNGSGWRIIPGKEGVLMDRRTTEKKETIQSNRQTKVRIRNVEPRGNQRASITVRGFAVN
ncbi:MAG: hypothetical protein OIF50_13485 [Flavobacteriaceae bacterium]|nr:hypothetical protein [Flavobacteriaceae bacterium]